MSMTDVHDHLWTDIFQHVQLKRGLEEVEIVRFWIWRYHLFDNCLAYLNEDDIDIINGTEPLDVAALLEIVENVTGVERHKLVSILDNVKCQ